MQVGPALPDIRVEGFPAKKHPGEFDLDGLFLLDLRGRGQPFEKSRGLRGQEKDGDDGKSGEQETGGIGEWGGSRFFHDTPWLRFT